MCNAEIFKITNKSDSSDYSPTGLSWDQEEIDDAYRRYDPEKYKKQHNPQGGDQNALI